MLEVRITDQDYILWMEKGFHEEFEPFTNALTRMGLKPHIFTNRYVGLRLTTDSDITYHYLTKGQIKWLDTMSGLHEVRYRLHSTPDLRANLDGMLANLGNKFTINTEKVVPIEVLYS